MFVTIQENLVVNLNMVSSIKQRMSNAQKVVEVTVDGKTFIVKGEYIKDIMKALESYKMDKLSKQFFAG